MSDLQGPLTHRGYFLMQRGWMNFQLFKSEPYTQREAWAYLIEHAAYEDVPREVDGMVVIVKRGQVLASYRYLAKAWGWKKDRVSRFLDKLIRHRWVKVDTSYNVKQDNSQTHTKTAYNRRSSLITIMHYNMLQRREAVGKFQKRDSNERFLEAAIRQQHDKPNQYQASESKEIKNQMAGLVSADKFLFEIFPEVRSPGDFINYMPNEWQNYALQEKGWHIDEIISEARIFWERYAGEDLEDRRKKQYSLEQRTNWFRVWKKWCDQEFRNVGN